MILSDQEESPSHIFVVHQFGFCQELFSEYREEFGDKIREYICCSNKKLRLYNPDARMKKWLDTLDRTKPSKRIHFWNKRNQRENSKRETGFHTDVFEMCSYDGRYDFGLNLTGRFYKNKDDFLKYAKPIYARCFNNPAGIVYSAGFDGLRNEVDLFVSEPYRNQGVAKSLINRFCNVIEGKNEELTWDCYSDNEASRRLAEYIGFDKSEEYIYYNIEPMVL